MVTLPVLWYLVICFQLQLTKRACQIQIVSISIHAASQIVNSPGETSKNLQLNPRIPFLIENSAVCAILSRHTRDLVKPNSHAQSHRALHSCRCYRWNAVYLLGLQLSVGASLFGSLTQIMAQ